MIKLRKDAFSKIKALSADVRRQIDDKLLQGEPASEVTSWLQNDVEVITDIKPDSLKKMLERYRATELRNRVHERIAEAAGVGTGRVSNLHRKVNAMERLDEIAETQYNRLQKLMQAEVSLAPGLVMKSVSDEIMNLKSILVDLGKLQLETGVMQRAPKQITGSLTDGNGLTTAFTWTEEQQKLVAELEGMVIEDLDE